ncbi:hypothetical protein [Defluviimonas salinarum]|uniref:Uncharacterized protein n=1 Tax=Defluviimonas salinarum TaxID=2992147 RepID=A0ABT3J5N2_9RHOB|nr:hypothetical protein [Defluviimonas salinarum]MCW3782966.1 hypothetical protein [Defluviimonas salinarum]
MGYTHVFTLPLKVGVSVDKEGGDVTGAHLLEILRARVAEFERDPELLKAAISLPLESREIDLWCMVKIDAPRTVRQADGGWAEIPEDGRIRTEDLVETSHAANMRLPQDAVWVRAEDALSPPVLGRLNSEDRAISANVDIRPWLANAETHDIEGLEAEGWSFSEASEWVARGLKHFGDPTASRLFAYLSLNPTMGFMREPVGFSVETDEVPIMTWLAANRPAIHERIAGTLGVEP